MMNNVLTELKYVTFHKGECDTDHAEYLVGLIEHA